MKELSIEQKAKAYDKAVEKIKYVMELGARPVLNKEDVLQLFPQLKESEDERIKKAIIDIINNGYSEYAKEFTHQDLTTWLEKQGNIDLEFFENDENEKREFVGYGFLKCKGDFLSFKEGETYWLEYIGKDNYNVRSDNLLGQTFHITPQQLYTVFRPTTWLEKQGQVKNSAIPQSENKTCKENGNSLTSEDDNIKKGIRSILEHYKESGEVVCPYPFVSIEDCLVWLEKQGEQNPDYCHHEVDLSNCSEEYRKAYYDGWNNCNIQHSQCQSESNDVVKCLINGMKFYYEDNDEATWGTDKFSMKVKDILSWLEKQGGQNPYSGASFEYNGHTFGMCARDGGVEILMDSELKAFVSPDKSFVYPNRPQKILVPQSVHEAVKEEKADNANKVEPKFKVGDKIIEKDFDECGCGTIVDIKDGKYIFDDEFFIYIEEQGNWELVEQNPTDKVEPKFKVGDWITDNKALLHVTKFEVEQGYELKAIDGNVFHFVSPDLVEEYYRLWTIEDAKDGDVLFEDKISSLPSPFIVIFKKKDSVNTFSSHCFIGFDGKFYEGEGDHYSENLHPATKEQRDLLFTKMKEAGYEWNAEELRLDKVEPKFKVGDWLQYRNAKPFFVEEITKQGYVNGDSCLPFNWENEIHLWTIQDAKDGDVLATDSWLYIFKYTNNKNLIQFHCSCPIDGKPHKWCFSSDDSYLDIYIDANIHPATKEQRGLLFSKMKEAGYEWDADKKESKLLITNGGDFKSENYEQKSAWSEEDEEELKAICTYIQDYPRLSKITDIKRFNEYADWLKSFKDRLQPQPKQEWGEEDENHIKSIISTIECCKSQFPNAQAVVEAYNSDIKWLKSLKDKYTWEPSDEHYELEEFAKIVRGNLTGISKAVQKLFKTKYLQLTGNKMYGGYKD